MIHEPICPYLLLMPCVRLLGRDRSDRASSEPFPLSASTFSLTRSWNCRCSASLSGGPTSPFLLLMQVPRGTPRSMMGIMLYPTTIRNLSTLLSPSQNLKSEPPNPAQASIMVLIIDGAYWLAFPVQSVFHFSTIRKSMQKNVHNMKMSWGIATVKRLKQLFFLTVLIILMPRPNSIWITPRITASFILKLLVNCILFSATFQIESMPSGYTQSGILAALVGTSEPTTQGGIAQQLLKSPKLSPKNQLQMRPQYPMKKRTIQTHALNLKQRTQGMAMSMWPTSPNMTPMKKANVTMYSTAGLNYPQLGIPQVFRISWGISSRAKLVNFVGGCFGDYFGVRVSGGSFSFRLSFRGNYFFGMKMLKCRKFLDSTMAASFLQISLSLSAYPSRQANRLKRLCAQGSYSLYRYLQTASFVRCSMFFIYFICAFRDFIFSYHLLVVEFMCFVSVCRQARKRFILLRSVLLSPNIMIHTILSASNACYLGVSVCMSTLSSYNVLTQECPLEIRKMPFSRATMSLRLIIRHLKSKMLALLTRSFCLVMVVKSSEPSRVTMSAKSTSLSCSSRSRWSSSFFCRHRQSWIALISSSISLMYRYPWIFLSSISFRYSPSRSRYVPLCCNLNLGLMEVMKLLISFSFPIAWSHRLRLLQQ